MRFKLLGKLFYFYKIYAIFIVICIQKSERMYINVIIVTTLLALSEFLMFQQ